LLKIHIFKKPSQITKIQFDYLRTVEIEVV